MTVKVLLQTAAVNQSCHQDISNYQQETNIYALQNADVIYDAIM